MKRKMTKAECDAAAKVGNEAATKAAKAVAAYNNKVEVPTRKTQSETEAPKSTSTMKYADPPKHRRTLSILNPKDLTEMGAISEPAAVKPAAKPQEAVRCTYIMPGGLQCIRSEHSDTDHKFAAGEPPSETVELEPLAQKSPAHPIAKAILRLGFKYAKSVRINDRDIAHGYTHADGSAAIFMHDTTSTEIGARWTIKTKASQGAEGKTASEFVTARLRQTDGDLPSANILSALRVLGKETGDTYDIASIKNEDAGYGSRLRVLKALRGSLKVVVKDAEPAKLRKELYTALGVKTAGAFTVQVIAVLKDADHRQKLLKATEEDIDVARRRTVGVKPVEKIHKPNKVDRKNVIEGVKAELLARDEDTETATPDPLRAVVYDAKAIRALELRNGVVCLQLEAMTSLGAIVVRDNGTCVAACVASKKDLLAARVMPDQDPLDLARRLLDPLNKKVTVKPAAVAHLQMFFAAAKLAELREADGPVEPAILPVADYVPEPSVVPAMAMPFRSPDKSAILQIERANSQGALVVYNNGRRVLLGVAPPEVLRVLRPGIAADANQLLVPNNGVPVTRVAESHLTAVLEYRKENIEMADKKAAKKFEAPAGVAKKAGKAGKVAKTDQAPRAGIAVRLLNDTKATWSAFKGQKGVIIAAMLAIKAVGKTGTSVTSSALAKAVKLETKQPAERVIGFYFSTWKSKGIVEAV